MRFEPVASRYQCDALTNWAMKPLMLGTHKSLKTSFNLILFSLITSSQVVKSQTWKINCNNVKVHLGSCLQVIIVPSAADCQKVFAYNHINEKDQWLLKEQILEWKSIISPSVPPFSCTWKTRSKFWKSWVFSRWRKTHIQAPHFQNLVAFVLKHSLLLKGPAIFEPRSKFLTMGPTAFCIAQTFRSWGQPFCSNFAKISHVGWVRRIKVPTSSFATPPPPSHMTLMAALNILLGHGVLILSGRGCGGFVGGGLRCWAHIPTPFFTKILHQGCALRKIEGNPVLWNFKI